MVKRSSAYLHFWQEYEDDSSIKLDLHHLVTSEKVHLDCKSNYFQLYTSFNKGSIQLAQIWFRGDFDFFLCAISATLVLQRPL